MAIKKIYVNMDYSTGKLLFSQSAVSGERVNTLVHK